MSRESKYIPARGRQHSEQNILGNPLIGTAVRSQRRHKRSENLSNKKPAKGASAKQKHIREPASKRSSTQFAVAKKPENLLQEPPTHLKTYMFFLPRYIDV